MGGPSEERPISLKSGAAVVSGLQKAGYQVAPIDVTSDTLELPADIEAVFIALHGSFGEDGTVQEMLEKLRIPYTGPGPEASRLSFDKWQTKLMVEGVGLPTPPSQLIRPGSKRTLPLPVVIKPFRQGSSIGVNCVFSEDEWDRAMQETLRYGDSFAEKFIEGRELTVGIVNDTILPIIEIRAPNGQYNYQAKYTKGVTEYLVPAPIPEDRADLCKEMALCAYKALGCRGISRVDFRMTPDGDCYILENNTIPGFTETSLLPKAALSAGIDFVTLCDQIMSSARLD